MHDSISLDTFKLPEDQKLQCPGVGHSSTTVQSLSH